jgi:GT2 family glycosyltransferase
MSSEIDRSNGFLPLAPLRHAEPTAVGVWDMDRAGTVMRPLELPVEGVRDQLVLARLHRQPLAVVHVEEPPGTETRASLMSAVWQAASQAIIEHVTEQRCLRAPEDHEELAMMLDADGGSACAGSTARRPPGKAAVVLCTTGTQQDTLARCLQALTRLNTRDFEVIVVDNRPSSPHTRALVEGFLAPCRIRYVPEPRPGLARARNTGVAVAHDATYVAFTDDDVVVDPEWLAWLLEPFAQPQVEAVTGLVMPLRLGSPAEKRFEHYAGFGKGVSGARYDGGEHAADDRFLYPYWGGMFGSGNSMAFRRDALDAVGGFDPALGAGTPTAGGEDLAAFTDVVLHGGQIVYEPRALCWHEHRGDEQALRTQVHNYGIGLTALLWRYLIRDRRFARTLIRSLPAIVALARSREADRELDQMPADLARLELRGRMLGPWRYIVSQRRAQPPVKDNAARQSTGERRRTVRGSGATGQMTGERRRPEADQAGAQTRT